MAIASYSYTDTIETLLTHKFDDEANVYKAYVVDDGYTYSSSHTFGSIDSLTSGNPITLASKTISTDGEDVVFDASNLDFSDQNLTMQHCVIVYQVSGTPSSSDPLILDMNINSGAPESATVPVRFSVDGFLRVSREA